MNAIQHYLQNNYSDEKLAALLAHTQEGKLAYNSCCCFVGVATADHPLQDELIYGKEIDCSHYFTLAMSGIGQAAQSEFYKLGKNDEQRREKLIPMIFEEIARRDGMRELQDEFILSGVLA